MKVFIVGSDNLIEKMWKKNGHEIVHKAKHADVIQYIGGADVDPSLYGEKIISGTHTSPAADSRDLMRWNDTVPMKQFSVGICRGGQFLNVMNGGSMWQHVNGHGQMHKVIDVTGMYEEEFHVTSTHHQMMIPAKHGEVLAYADNISSGHRSNSERVHDGVDPEVIWYDKTRCLCYQPHPEYTHFGEMNRINEEYFFSLIKLLR